MSLTITMISLVNALAPPHADGGQELAEYHQRLLSKRQTTAVHDQHESSSSSQSTRTKNTNNNNNNIERPNKPFVLEKELCQDMTDAECYHMHTQMHHHGRKLRQIADVHGLVRTLVLLVRFQDHQERELVSHDDIQYLFTATDSHEELAPSGSVRSFLHTNAHGSYEQVFDVMDWRTTDNTEAYFGKGTSGLHRDVSRLMHAVLTQLDNEGTDWSLYDLNNDGVIDNIIIVHSGHPAEHGGHDCYGTHFTDRIWSHRRYDGKWKSSGNAYQAGIVSFAPSVRGLCHNRITRMGIVVHEFLHMFNLPDLVDHTWKSKGVGMWDCMGNSQGIDLSGTYPTHLSIWSKMHLDWVRPTLITQDGQYRIRAAENTTDAYLIKSPFPEQEYFLIENRQPILWDRQLWNGGILIWHIDESRNLNRATGFPGQPGWPSNGHHYELALVQADGNYDLERNRNFADDGDYWRDGAELGPGPVELEATDDGVYPNTNSYRFGVVQQTGIRIYDFSPSQYEMTFRVEGIAAATTTAPTPVPATPAPTPVPATPAPTPVPATPAPTSLPTTQSPTPLPTTLAPITDAPITSAPTTAAPTTANPTFFGSQPPSRSVSPTTLPSSLPTIPPPSTIPSSWPSSLPTAIAPSLSPITTTPGPNNVNATAFFQNGTWMGAPFLPFPVTNMSQLLRGNNGDGVTSGGAMRMGYCSGWQDGTAILWTATVTTLAVALSLYA